MALIVYHASPSNALGLWSAADADGFVGFEIEGMEPGDAARPEPFWISQLGDALAAAGHAPLALALRGSPKQPLEAEIVVGSNGDGALWVPLDRLLGLDAGDAKGVGELRALLEWVAHSALSHPAWDIGIGAWRRDGVAEVGLVGLSGVPELGAEFARRAAASPSLSGWMERSKAGLLSTDAKLDPLWVPSMSAASLMDPEQADAYILSKPRKPRLRPGKPR